MKKRAFLVQLFLLSALALLIFKCQTNNKDNSDYYVISKESLKDKIKGAWAAQTIGVTYGGPTEFRYNKRIIPDSVMIHWSDTMMYHWMTRSPGLYDDIYMDLTFVEVMEKEGINAPATSHANAYAEAKYWLWHANQQGRYNILNGMSPPESGHWLNNPHADDIDFQIEADFAGIMNPGMPNSALEVCDRVGHIMNYGDGYYGGVLMATMYSYAFVMDDIKEIINQSLAHIPPQSTFYQCINDVVSWHNEHPNDWKMTWQLIEDKWGNDIGCPDGVHRDFNIDAKINAAYVILGLLYGDGDLGKTMEISTRAGQDSDCNPASSGAIIGTIIGYDAIPGFWSNGLGQIEDMDFQYTSTSLNDVYEISYQHALELIEKNGGLIDGELIKIKKEPAVVAPLEQSFPGYKVVERRNINQKIYKEDDQKMTIEFSGTGIVATGQARNKDFENAYALISEEETAGMYQLEIDCIIDGEHSKTMSLPLYFIERAHEIFYQYELPNGDHELQIIIKNQHEKVYLKVGDVIVYTKEKS